MNNKVKYVILFYIGFVTYIAIILTKIEHLFYSHKSQ